MTQAWTCCITLVFLVAGCTEQMASKDKEEMESDDEVEVSMEQLPPAVKSTLMKESGGGKIDEIVKVTEDGKTLYESDVMLNGQKWELAISDSGALLHKKMEKDEKKSEKEEDEKDEKDEKEEKGARGQ